MIDPRYRNLKMNVVPEGGAQSAPVRPKGAFGGPPRRRSAWDALKVIGGTLQDLDGSMGYGHREAAMQGLRSRNEQIRLQQENEARQAKMAEFAKTLTPEQQTLFGLNPNAAIEGMTQQAFSQPETQDPFVVNGRVIDRNDPSRVVADYSDPKTPTFKTVTTDEGIFQYDPANPQTSMQFLGKAPEKSPLVAVNTGDQADPRPLTDKPSKDFQRVWDESSRSYRDEVIPGTATARERELLNSKAFQALQANNEQFDAIMTNIDAADELIGPLTAGVGSYMEGLRGTPARDLAARMETVKANIGFDKLNEMRQTSPTGGALGQVTERELKFLQSVRGSLDEGQSPAQLRETLGEIKASLQRLQEVREIAFKLEQQNAAKGQIVSTDPLSSGDLPSGFALQGEDADLLEFMTPEERSLFEGGSQ